MKVKLILLTILAVLLGTASLLRTQVLAADGSLGFTTYPISMNEQLGPTGPMINGPGGDIWYECGGPLGQARICKMTGGGIVTSYPFPANVTTFIGYGLTEGSDGNVWLEAQGEEPDSGPLLDNIYMAKVTPAGNFTLYPVDDASGASPAGSVATGPDGNVWFSMDDGNIDSGGTVQPSTAFVGKITPSGVVTKYLIPSGYEPAGITAGNDGNVWFMDEETQNDANDCSRTVTCIENIARVTPNGTITEFPVPSGQYVTTLTTGPDNSVWFEAEGTHLNNSSGLLSSYIGKIDASGNITEFPLPAISEPEGLTVDANGNLWFLTLTNSGTQAIEEMTPDGVGSIFPLPSTLWADAYSPILSSPDGSLWFDGQSSTEDSSGNYTYYMIRANTSAVSPPPDLLDTGFRPSTDGFGFQNPGVPTLSQASFEQYFGNAVTTDNGKLTTEAEAFYSNNYEKSGANGVCFGISGASAINWDQLDQTNAGSFTIPESQTYPAYTSDTEKPGSSSHTLAEIIGYYQGTQQGMQNQELLASAQDSPAAISSYLSSIEQSINSGNPITIGIIKNVQTPYYVGSQALPINHTVQSGHALLAYKYEVSGDTTKVYVYDSNHDVNDGYGDSDNEYITFNTQNDSWAYNPEDSLGAWGSGAAGGEMQVFPLSSSYTTKGVLDDSTHSLIWWPDTFAATISDANGGTTGFVNGQLETNASGGTLVPSMDDGANSESGQEFMTTSGNSYTINESNVTGTQGPIDIFGSDSYATVSGLTPSINDSAQVQLGSDGKSVTVSSSSKVSNYSVTLDQEISGKSLTFTVSGASLNPGEKTTFALLGSDGQLQIKNSGANKTYSVTMQETGGNNSTLTENNVSLGGSATDTWAPTDWDNLSSTPLNLTVDQDSNGKAVSTVVANALSINSGSLYTQTNKVTLDFAPSIDATQMRISNSPFAKNSKYWPKWQKFSSAESWQLPDWDGKHTVYVQFKATNGTVSNVYSSSIVLDNIKPQIYWVSINGGKMVANPSSTNVHIYAGDWVSPITSMRVSDSGNLSSVGWEPYQDSFSWSLGSTSDKRQYVYVQVEDAAGNISGIYKVPVWELSQK